MKKKLYIISFLIIFFSVIFLNSKSYRYIGVNYIIERHEISNFQKLSEFYERHTNYKELVKKILHNSLNKKDEIMSISIWVFENIKKISNKDLIIDNHPWTIVERKVGTSDQFSDILSVLLVYANVDSFFTMGSNKIFHPMTFFKYNNRWSIIDPYYGIYFTNNKKYFSSLKEIKNDNLLIYHLNLGKVTSKNLSEVFFDKNFKNIQELNIYYKFLLQNIASSETIDDTNIYERGGRSYIQKPLHRILQQLKTLLKI